MRDDVVARQCNIAHMISDIFVTSPLIATRLFSTMGFDITELFADYR